MHLVYIMCISYSYYVHNLQSLCTFGKNMGARYTNWFPPWSISLLYVQVILLLISILRYLYQYQKSETVAFICEKYTSSSACSNKKCNNAAVPKERKRKSYPFFLVCLAECGLFLLQIFCFFKVINYYLLNNYSFLLQAHYIKDRSCNTTKAVLALESSYKWALSGTPLQNRVGELYSLVSICT